MLINLNSLFVPLQSWSPRIVYPNPTFISSTKESSYHTSKEPLHLQHKPSPSNCHPFHHVIGLSIVSPPLLLVLYLLLGQKWRPSYIRLKSYASSQNQSFPDIQVFTGSHKPYYPQSLLDVLCQWNYQEFTWEALEIFLLNQIYVIRCLCCCLYIEYLRKTT